MAQYGVGTTNPYDALDEEAPVKKAAAPVAPALAPAPKVPEPSRTLDASNKRGGGFPRGRGRGGRGGGIGGRGRGTGNRAPRRVFDRHSGTGRGKEVRKGGYGGYDAEGTMQDDIKAEDVTKQLTLEDAKPADAPAPQVPEVKAPETEEEKAAREEAEKEAAAQAAMLTYDQYMELKKKKAVEDDAKLQVRQVQIDEKKFKAVKAFEKDGDDGYDDILGTSGADKEEAGKKKGDKKAKKVKHLDEVLAELPGGAKSAPAAMGAPAFRGRGGRGGRGGPRGGPRGGFASIGRGVAPMKAVDYKSDADFPKLGK